MNIVKILLVLGLGYVALTQKVEKTRNMLLVVTGLLAFCMFSMEGFTIATGDVDSTFQGDTIDAGPPKTITASGTNAPIYTVTGDITATTDSITGITCKMAATDSANGTIGLTTDAAGPNFQLAAASISTMFTCEAADDSADSACAGYSADNKPPFCECLKKTEGGHYHCNSGWTGEPGSQGKYIAKNAAGDGWEFKDDYSDEKVYKCDADMLSGISGGAVELFSGKCYVKKDETQECLNLCDPPTSTTTS